MDEIGPLDAPKVPWAVVRTDGCQYGMVSQAENDGTKGVPVEKGQLWVANRDLSCFSLRCGKPDALGSISHDHRAIRGTMKVIFDDGKEHWAAAGVMSGIYTPACCDAYWQVLLPTFRSAPDPDQKSSTGSIRVSSPAMLAMAPSGQSSGLPGSVAGKEETNSIPRSDVNSGAVELSPAEMEALEREISDLSKRMDAHWKELALGDRWDEVKADLSVYRLSGQEITSDPRRTNEYRDQVIEGLGFGNGENRRSDLTGDDFLACKDVLTRKAAGFWVEGTPRTTVRMVAHDTVPTGPPVSLQPHALKGEAAAWVDEKLEEEVKRGQLVRGSSAWGSPPFPTKEAPTHKRHRKRRLVVDYRRVNARVLRSTYYCRRASDVLAQCSGSVWFSFVDAVTGFNQIANTRRAMEVLAIVARSGKFLPVCLTFGPVNGPDDFSYVVDRAFGPGRNRKLRFTREWIGYVDDLTIRTGRTIDGKFFTDEEHDQEVKEAMRRAPVEVPQTANEAIEALGIRQKGIGSETKRKHDVSVSDHNHPTRQRSWYLIRSRVRYPQGVVLGIMVCFWDTSLRFLFPQVGLVVGVTPVDPVGYLVSLPQPFGSSAFWVEEAGFEGGVLSVDLLKNFGTKSVRQLWSAGPGCVSRPARDQPDMGKKGRGKGNRRDPEKNWSDLEYLLCQTLRHGYTKSSRGWHSLQGKIGSNGWVPMDIAARALGVGAEDIVEVVRWHANSERKKRLEMDAAEVQVRALQGHTPDSGLTPEDFSEGVQYGDETLLAHGTVNERVPNILKQGLLAAGAGSHEGRLFVHWSATALGVQKKEHSGLRGGSDAVVIARLGDLLAAGVRAVQGKDGVVLTGDVPASLFTRISTWLEGQEGEILWTADGGLVPVELPTGDTESSLEILEFPRTAVPLSDRGRGSQVKVEESEDESSSPEAEPAKSPGSATQARKGLDTEEVKEAVALLGKRTPAEEELCRQINEEVARELSKLDCSSMGTSGSATRREAVQEAYTAIRKRVQEEKGYRPRSQEEIEVIPKEGLSETKGTEPVGGEPASSSGSVAGKKRLPMPIKPSVPVSAGSSTAKREEDTKSEYYTPRSTAESPKGSAPTGVSPAVAEAASRVLGDRGQGSEERVYDKSRGEMSPLELQEIWAKKPRTGGQKALEHNLAAAASSELRYQEEAQQGFENLVNKQAEKPTPGGKDQLDRQVKAISSSATSSLAFRKRAGRDNECEAESHAYGRSVTEVIPDARQRLRAAEAIQPEETTRDSRYEAGVRAGLPDRQLKKQARSRARAEEHRKEVKLDMARERLKRTLDKAEEEESEEGPLSRWDVDDGLDELTYEYGSWHCASCNSVNGPTVWDCQGWLEGSKCNGTYDHNFSRWAASGPAPVEKKKKKRAVKTRLEEALKKESWSCARCHRGNLSYRVKCFRCSYPRTTAEKQGDSSGSEDSEDYGAKRSADTEAMAEAFLKQKKDLGLRKPKKRGGVRHQRKKKKKRRIARGRPAAGSAVRVPRAVRSKKKKARKKKKPKKKLARGWYPRRKDVNRQKRSENGNTSWTQLWCVVACLVAVPVYRETEEVIATTSEAVQDAIFTASEAFQEVVSEGSHQLKTMLELAGWSIQFGIVWFVASRVVNLLRRCENGNTTSTRAKLASLDGDESVWIIPGTGTHHRVRLVGTRASCACRGYVQKGNCAHVIAAREALRSLGTQLSAKTSAPISEERSREASGYPSAVARGLAALPGHSGPDRSVGLSACFQGLVDKAKSMRGGILALEAPPPVEKTQSQKVKIVKESLSLDSLSEVQPSKSQRARKGSAAGAASSRPGADPTVVEGSVGLTVKFLSNRESQDQALTNLRGLQSKDVKEVLMTAYTLDQPDVVEALSLCRVPMRLLVDSGQSRGNQTKLQWQSLQQLARAGVRIRLVSGRQLQETYAEDNRGSTIGRGLRGIQHSKTLLVVGIDQVDLVIGSSNWTTSSRGNIEMGVYIRGPIGTEVFEDYVKSFEIVWNAGTVFDSNSRQEDQPKRRVTGKQRPKADGNSEGE